MALYELLNNLNSTPSYINKNSAEVDIAPALGEITTACNVGQAKPGHGACMKSMSRTNTMQDRILTVIEKCILIVDST